MQELHWGRIYSCFRNSSSELVLASWCILIFHFGFSRYFLHMSFPHFLRRWIDTHFNLRNTIWNELIQIWRLSAVNCMQLKNARRAQIFRIHGRFSWFFFYLKFPNNFRFLLTIGKVSHREVQFNNCGNHKNVKGCTKLPSPCKFSRKCCSACSL